MKMDKRSWRRPELIILVRSRAEEAVLRTCKSEPEWIAGEAGDFHACNAVQDICYDGCYDDSPS